MSLTIIPSRYIPFQGDIEKEMISYVSLVNNSSKRFAYKFMSNSPRGKLLVNPRRGVVGPKEEVSVRVTMPPLKPLEKRTAYEIQIQTVEVVSSSVDLDYIWKNVGWRKISTEELAVCFVGNSGEQKLESNVPVFNFAPVPSSVHLFGGTVLRPKSDAARKAKGLKTNAPTWELNNGKKVVGWTPHHPTAQSPQALHVGNPILEEEKASWESNVPIVAIGTEPQQNWEAPIQNNEWNQAPAQTDNWDQAPAQTDNWDQAPAQTDNWDQAPVQTDNWDQAPVQTDNWDQAPAQTDNWDPAQAQPNIWDQAQTDDWNQDAADQNADLGHGGWDDQNANAGAQQNVDWNTDANQVVDENQAALDWNSGQVADPAAWPAAAPNDSNANRKDFEAEVLAASFKVWRESVFYAIAFFIFGMLLGKAGF